MWVVILVALIIFLIISGIYFYLDVLKDKISLKKKDKSKNQNKVNLNVDGSVNDEKSSKPIQPLKFKRGNEDKKQEDEYYKRKDFKSGRRYSDWSVSDEVVLDKSKHTRGNVLGNEIRNMSKDAKAALVSNLLKRKD